MAVAKPNIVPVPGSPANCYPDRRGYLLEGIVVHTMGGSLAGTDSWFANPAAKAGTHFGVGRNGEIHQYFTLDQGPFAHGEIQSGYSAPPVIDNGTDINPNWYLVGIEHDDLGKGALPTEVQFDASTRLAAWLFQGAILPNATKTGAVVDRDHIIRHAEISPVSRPNCPGWPESLMQRYVARVKELLMPAPTPPPAPDYKALYVAELKGELVAGIDDQQRAAVRIETVTRKLRELGEKV